MLAPVVYLVFLVVTAGCVQSENVANESDVQCNSEGYTYYPSTGHCYKVSGPRVRKTWDEAQAECLADNGHLLVLDSEEEMQAVKELFISPLAFVGLRDYSTSHSEWQSVTCKRMDEIYNKWKSYNGEPEYFEWYCGVVFPSGKIDNLPCTGQYPYICEKKP